MNKSVLRVVLFLGVFGLVVTLPWWLSAVILFGLTIYFPLYLEVIFFGFIFDTLYSAQFSFPYIGGTLALVLLLVVSFVKKNIRT